MSVPTFACRKSLARLACALQVLLAVVGPGSAETPGKSAAPEARKRELFRLPNEDLLQQARSLLRKNEDAFRGEMRGLATAETLLERARAQTLKVDLPEKLPPAPVHGKEAAPDGPKAAVAFAQTRLEAFRRRLNLHEAEKALLENLAAQVQAADSAALGLANALDELGSHVLEISLRREDGTLAEIPPDLTSTHLAKRKDALRAEQTRLKQRSRSARKELEDLGRVLDEARKDLGQAEAEHALAARKFARETRRQEAERQFAGQDLEHLRDRLRVLHEEEVGLRGTFNLALRRFRVRSEHVAALRGELAAMKEPAAEVPPVVRTEDVDQAVQATQALLDHAGKRLEAMTRIGSSLEELVRLGSACEGDAAVLEEHLFKMQVLVAATKARGENKKPSAAEKKTSPDRKGKESSMPAEPAAPDPARAIVELNRTVSEVVGTTGNVRKELQDLQTRIDRTRTAIREDRTRLAALKQTLEATRQVLQWEEKLRGFTTEQAVASFLDGDKQLQESTARLPAERAAFGKAREELAKAHARLDSLKDPLFREAEKDLLSERSKILNELRKYAGLERNTKTEGNPPAPVPPRGSVPAGKERAKEKEDRAGLAQFQQLLSTWARIIDQQAEKKAEVLRMHAALGKVLDHYAQTLAETRRLALQQHATAIDLKKRLGRGDLQPDRVPEGVAEALKRDLLARLESDATILVNAREPLQEEADRLARPEKELREIRSLARDILGHIGRRLDLTEEITRLEQDSKKELDQRSESETKRIEQAAAQRQADDDTPVDFFLSLDTSPAAQRLTELLQSYYRELVDLEERSGSLETQRGRIEKLLDTAQKEQALVLRIRPLLAALQEELARNREDEFILVRARLRPDEADELLKAHQARTGRLVNKPPPVAEKDRPGTVAAAAQDLFEADLRLEALRRWDRLLAGRLSPGGIDAEMGGYQERLGGLNARRGALQRRLDFLQGPSRAEAAKEPAPQAAPDETETTGEIERVRRERFRIRRAGVLRMVAKIAVVLLLAFLLPRLAGLLLARVGRREGVSTHGRLVLSFLRAFLKLIVWIAALVIILSTLGFDITAILAALGIGGLAIGLAAQETIADIIGGILIFVERPFSIGDTIVIGEAEPARVTGLTWRATRLRTPSGIDLTVPNREVMKSNIRNLTKNGLTYDSLVLPLPVNLPIDRVLTVLGEGLATAPSPSSMAARGVEAPELEMAEAEAFVRYTPWWHIEDYDRRNAIRAEVLAHLWKHLDQAGLVTRPDSA